MFMHMCSRETGLGRPTRGAAWGAGMCRHVTCTMQRAACSVCAWAVCICSMQGARTHGAARMIARRPVCADMQEGCVCATHNAGSAALHKEGFSEAYIHNIHTTIAPRPPLRPHGTPWADRTPTIAHHWLTRRRPCTERCWSARQRPRPSAGRKWRRTRLTGSSSRRHRETATRPACRLAGGTPRWGRRSTVQRGRCYYCTGTTRPAGRPEQAPAERPTFPALPSVGVRVR